MSNRDYYTPSEKQRENDVMSVAYNNGYKWAGISFVGVGALSFIASQKSVFYQKRLGPSARASFPIMATIFAGSLAVELTAYDAKRNPTKWGLSGEPIVSSGPQSSLVWYKKCANYLDDHPMLFIIGVGLPFVMKVFHDQNKLEHLTLPQKIMKSRVIGQFGVVTLCVSTMIFKIYMARNGKFFDPNDTRVETKSNTENYICPQ